jgi:hypothetical protein
VRIFKRHPIAGTLTDGHGEQTPITVLKEFAAAHRGSRIALNQRHDFLSTSPGYIENLEVIENPHTPNEWILVGDIYLDEGTLEDALGGFSISFIESLSPAKVPGSIHVYLPYPYYKNAALVAEFTRDANYTVGRWRKKALDHNTVALVALGVTFLLRPVWDEIYKEKVSPALREFFCKFGTRMSEEGIEALIAQKVEFNGQEYEIFMHAGIAETAEPFSLEATSAAMHKAHTIILARSTDKDRPLRIHFQFSTESNSYALAKIDYNLPKSEPRT